MHKQRYMLNADVALEVYATDADEARELAERFVEEAAAHDPHIHSACVAAMLFGPEVYTDDDESGVVAPTGAGGQG